MRGIVSMEYKLSIPYPKNKLDKIKFWRWINANVGKEGLHWRWRFNSRTQIDIIDVDFRDEKHAAWTALRWNNNDS